MEIPKYKLRGFRSPSDVIAYENEMLLKFSEMMLYQPENPNPEESGLLAPVEQNKGVSARSPEIDLLRSNLRTLMKKDYEISTLIALLSPAEIEKINKNWHLIHTKLSGKNDITAAKMRLYIDQFFRSTNFFIVDEE